MGFLYSTCYMELEKKINEPIHEPAVGADLRAALVANCFLGAFPPVDFLAVCLVRAMVLSLGKWRYIFKMAESFFSLSPPTHPKGILSRQILKK